MQLGPINGKHTDKFTFLLDVNNVQSLYYPAIHLCILHALITQAIRHKKLHSTTLILTLDTLKLKDAVDWCKCFPWHSKGPNIALNERTHLRATERHLSYGITQCYLPPDRGERAPL